MVEAKDSEQDQHMAEEEIKKFAEDLYKGLIFTDRHLQNPNDISSVFLPMALLNKEQIEDLKSRDPGMIYEYMENAGPRSINGMPMFLSVRFLSQEDTKKVIEKYNKIVEAIGKV